MKPGMGVLIGLAVYTAIVLPLLIRRLYLYRKKYGRLPQL